MDKLSEMRRDAMKVLRPPQRLQLSEWIESTIVLPSSLSALRER